MEHGCKGTSLVAKLGSPVAALNVTLGTCVRAVGDLNDEIYNGTA